MELGKVGNSTNNNLQKGVIHRLHWWSIGWFATTIVLTLSVDFGVLQLRPALLHNWQGMLIIVLSLSIIFVYGMCTLRRNYVHWPPPLTSSLAIFAVLYGFVLTLSLIDNNFAWDFFIVLGAALSRFSGRLLLVLTTILFVSLCILGGILSLPFNWNELSSVFGISIFFFGSSASSLLLQNMFKERAKSERLLKELTQAHAELSDAHQRLAQTAVQEKELAILRERTRLARELHDTLGHDLVLVTIKLEIAQRLHERNPAHSNSELVASQQIVRKSLSELRASIANLRSPTLEHEPAYRALSHYAREMAQRAGIAVSYDLQSDLDGLPEQVEETLWKVGQEAIANIEKHAHASNLLLHMSRYAGFVQLRVEDDGVGLPQHCNAQHTHEKMVYPSPAGHYGLNGMMERVERIGGTLSLRPGAERGTLVEVELPLSAVEAIEPHREIPS